MLGGVGPCGTWINLPSGIELAATAAIQIAAFTGVVVAIRRVRMGLKAA